MADLNTEVRDTNRAHKIRSRKLSSKVDLTAMVDLAFLLITFFMLTTSLTKPQAMDLTMPSDGEPAKVDENRTMTVLIGPNSQLKCFMGMAGSHPPKTLVSGSNAFRAEVLANKQKAIAYSKAKGEKGKDLIVLIKPSEKSNYRSLVDVLDEMAISGVQTYAIADFTLADSKLLGMR